MRLETKSLQFLTKNDYRTLNAVELGMKNHQLVELVLIQKLSSLPTSALRHSLTTLMKHKLLHHEASKCDGYRLTPHGYDALALHSLKRGGILTKVGTQIGVGKEADVCEATAFEETKAVLKLHRLGRVSFRNVKNSRDYLHGKSAGSWLNVSRLAAEREFRFLKALWEMDFPVPKPLGYNRHCILMARHNGLPLFQCHDLIAPHLYCEALLALARRLAKNGLVHCDLNEFNVLVQSPLNAQQTKSLKLLEMNRAKNGALTAEDATQELFEKLGMVVIDVPQMISTAHVHAKELYLRDVQSLKAFFKKSFAVEVELEDDVGWESVAKRFTEESQVGSLIDVLKRDRKAIQETVEKTAGTKSTKSVEMSTAEIRRRLKTKTKNKGAKFGKKNRAQLKNQANQFMK